MKRRNFADTSVGQFLTVLYDLIVVNLLWLVCSLPVITMGAATTAMFSVTFRIARKEPVSTLRTFFGSFWKNLKVSVLVTLVIAAGLVIFAGDLWYAAQLTGAARIAFICVSAVIGALTLSVLAWSFAQIACFENRFKGYLLNALSLAAVAPGSTVMIWCITAFPVLLALVMPMDVVITFGWFYVLFGASCANYWCVKVMEKVFGRISDGTVQPSEEE